MEKWKAVLTSSRFVMALVTIITIVASKGIGIDLDTEQLVAMVAIVIAWITGRTIRPDEKK